MRSAAVAGVGRRGGSSGRNFVAEIAMENAASLSPAVPRPAHIPPSAVYDFDFFYDPSYLADPHGRILDLVRKAPPVFWTPRQGGHWVLLSHAANFEASRDWGSFTSEVIPLAQLKAMNAALSPGAPRIPNAVPISLDPPEHTKYRAPLQSAFSPRAMAALKPSVKALAEELIDRVRPEGRCEFMSAVAEPLPVQVFLKMLGLPLERQAEYRALVRTYLGNLDQDPADSIRMLQHVAATMRETLLERRERPREDLISRLWQMKIDGQEMTLEDMENYGILLFIAGLDTVMNGMGFGVRHLAQDFALQDRLRKSPELIPAAMEELLRRYSFTLPPRRVAKDIEFEGVQMKAGERVLMFLPGADLDPEEFPSPERFDLSREGTPHIAFNSGPHRCLGSHLARVELQTLYEVMLARLPPFRLDPSHALKFHGGNVIGVDALHLMWDV